MTEPDPTAVAVARFLASVGIALRRLAIDLDPRAVAPPTIPPRPPAPIPTPPPDPTSNDGSSVDAPPAGAPEPYDEHQRRTWRESKQRTRGRREPAPTVCPTCDRTFKNAAGAVSHAATCGTNHTKAHPCPECGAKWPTIKELEAHRADAHDVPFPNAHRCPVCARAFHSRQALSLHQTRMRHRVDTDDMAEADPESATQSGPASAPPGRAPTTEDLDPLDPGHLVYVCPDCPTEHTEAINANAHQKRTGHGQWTRENRRRRRKPA